PCSLTPLMLTPSNRRSRLPRTRRVAAFQTLRSDPGLCDKDREFRNSPVAGPRRKGDHETGAPGRRRLDGDYLMGILLSAAMLGVTVTTVSSAACRHSRQT